MREIEFLPGWYPQIQRRCRAVIAQAWITVAIIVGLVGYAAARHVQVRNARAITAQCQAQINLSQQQLAQLSEKLKYEAQLRQQEQIVARLGLGVDTTRLLASLEDAMTPDMTLTDVSLETIELARPGALISMRSATSVRGDLPDVDRRLKVSVDGLAPSDMQVAALMENLTRVKCFENVAFPYLREARSRDGHEMREFQVTFELNLNPPAETKP